MMEILISGSTSCIRTLNQMGCMYNYNDEITGSFFKYAGSVVGTIADLGCAYGATTKRLLEAGAKDIISNDLCEGHLEILSASLNAEEKDHVRILVGNALNIASSGFVYQNSLAGILAANWLDLLEPEEIRLAFRLFFEWLRPNGKVCIVTAANNCCVVRDSNPNVKESIEKRKAAGDEWPGEIWTAGSYRGSCKLPDRLLLLDPDVLEREAKLAGFRSQAHAVSLTLSKWLGMFIT